MGKFLLRWLINALGLYLAARIVSGIHIGDQVGVVLGVALVFGLVSLTMTLLSREENRASRFTTQ